MSFDLHLLSFDSGEPSPMDRNRVEALVGPFITERESDFMQIATGDGSADLYGLATDGSETRSLMINHVSGTDPWSLVFELMDQCKLALMAPGAATCVPTEEVGGHLPDELVGWIVVRSGTELLEAVTTDPATAIHEDPAWQDRANYILRVDLEPHGMPGRFEQLWARQLGQDRFELCCIPFFIYGAALGDVVATGETPGGFEVIEHSGRRCIRVAFENGPIDDALHETFHAALVGARVAVEFHQPGYAAIDIPTEADIGRVVDAIRPFTESNGAVWEFADQWGSSG